ncbi:MAG: hypothetical protein OXF98_05470 [Rhodospirillaceae bacterium]|nr:hypothetical protein [Rhodospirillaceae bacterium]
MDSVEALSQRSRPAKRFQGTDLGHPNLELGEAALQSRRGPRL